jgi:hypothetical protein
MRTFRSAASPLLMIVGALAGCGAEAVGAPHVVVPIGEAPPALSSAVHSYRSVRFGKTAVGANPIEAKDAAGTWHSDVVVENGRVVRVERIGPSTLRTETTYVTYGADGAQTREVRDAYGVEAHTDELTPGGDRSRVQRSGAANENGCARIHETYDAHGLVESTSCRDVDGHIVTDADGCQVHRFEYDDRLRLHRERCFSEDGKPVAFRLGGQSVVVEYDARGFEEKITRANDDESEAVDDEGCASTRYTRDVGGNAAVVACLDAAGRPHGMSGTAAIETRKQYDPNGCLREEGTYDRGNAIVEILGVARRMHGRDPSCGELSLAQYDVDSKHAAPDLKVSGYEYVRNAEGLIVEERCHDANEAPVSCRDALGSDGALVRRTYDERGRTTLQLGFTEGDARSKMSRTYPHEWRFAYRPDGISYEVSYFDEDGAPAFANGTVAKHAFVFDRLGSLEDVKSFDASGRLTPSGTGCAVLRRTYDASHRLATVECRGADEVLTASTIWVNSIRWPTGTARVLIERTNNVVTGNAFYGVNGELLKRVTCGSERCFR